MYCRYIPVLPCCSHPFYPSLPTTAIQLWNISRIARIAEPGTERMASTVPRSELKFTKMCRRRWKFGWDFLFLWKDLEEFASIKIVRNDLDLPFGHSCYALVLSCFIEPGWTKTICAESHLRSGDNSCYKRLITRGQENQEPDWMCMPGIVNGT